MTVSFDYNLYNFIVSPIYLFLLISKKVFFVIVRVEYKQLDRLRDFLPDVPFVGLTATATEK